MADALRGSRDAAEYKPVVLGLIFLKYISDPSTYVFTKTDLQRNLFRFPALRLRISASWARPTSIKFSLLATPGFGGSTKCASRVAT